jgi:hypothetical protein
MNIDKHDFEYTAKAVYIMNPSARENYETWEDLYEFMVDMAHAYCHESNSFSTGGFCLTSYSSLDNRERYVRASVMGYVACQYAERSQRIKELARVL